MTKRNLFEFSVIIVCFQVYSIYCHEMLHANVPCPGVEMTHALEQLWSLKEGSMNKSSWAINAVLGTLKIVILFAFKFD